MIEEIIFVVTIGNPLFWLLLIAIIEELEGTYEWPSDWDKDDCKN